MRRRTQGLDQGAEDLQARLAAMLERLPEVVGQAVKDLHTLLAARQVARGRELLASLVKDIRLHPKLGLGGKRHVEAELRGNVPQTLTLAVPKARGHVQMRWLGEEDSNPR